MAVQAGEENVATLFGDVHYYYGPQTANPPHHRFDKDSYVYLFENAGTGRARIEIANRPGTEDQDAFDGFLDRAHIRYSYKRHCLVSVTVNDVPNQEEWHLPTFDPQNQNKYHYKLSSLDIYFWTQQDALQFVNGVRRVLPTSQCEVLDEPGPPPMSSLVQNLEKVALTNQNSSAQPQNGIPSFAPPPVAAEEPQSYAPVAYNPAAPAAPETIRAREKTPPPEDFGAVHPLHQTLAADAQTPFSPGLAPSGLTLGPLSPGIPPPSFHSPPGAPSFAAPPMHSVTSPGMPPVGFGQHPGLARAATMPAHALPSPGLHNPYAAGGGFPGVPGPATPGVSGVHRGPPVQHTPTPPAAAAGLPPPPPGGYSQYSYGQQAGAAGGADYSIHQQMYRPTETEATLRHNKLTARDKEPRGKLEENAGKLEKAATGMFKRLEKKFG